MANDVTYERKEYIAALKHWDLVDDVCKGDDQVKSKGQTHLPAAAELKDEEAKARYKAYKERAILYNVTKRTLNGMTGLAFDKKPNFETPEYLDFINSNVDGSNQSITQQSKLAVAMTLKSGNGILLVDARREGDNDSTPYISLYKRSSLINWRTSVVDGVIRPTLLVFKESHDSSGEEDYEPKIEDRWRELRIKDGQYIVKIWKKEEGSGKLILEDEIIPTNGSGQSWSYIPCFPIGAENNDFEIDDSPLLDLAKHNIKHYQVTAEWYNAIHYASQPVPTATGLDETWVKLLREEWKVSAGDGQILPLPQGGDFDYKYLRTDSAIKDDLKRLEDEMVALGAAILQAGGVNKTATQSRGDQRAQYSVLSSVALNVSMAYVQALGALQEFMRNKVEVVEVEIGKDLTISNFDPQVITALIQLWQSGRLPEPDMNNALKRSGLIDPEKSDESIQEELSETTIGIGL